MSGEQNDLRSLLSTAWRPESRLKVLREVMIKADTQKNIADRARMSEASVSKAVFDLRETGVLSSKLISGDIVQLAPTRGVALGVELGYQNVGIVARRADKPFTSAESGWITTDKPAYPRDFADALWEKIVDLCARLGEDPQDIASVGIGIPRMVKAQDQSLTPPLLPPWDTRPEPIELIAGMLRKRYGGDIPRLALDNDANLGALGEITYGGYGEGRRETFVFVKASTGIGAGIIIGGEQLRGRSGVAGELGHTMVRRSGALCLCGGRGCLETLVGAKTLIEQAKAALSPIRDRAPGGLKDLIAKAAAGDLVCRRVLEDAASTMGAALGNLCNVLNPDVIVLGGAWGRDPAPGILLGPCMAALKTTAMASTHSDGFELVGAAVEDAVAHGALIMGITGALTASARKDGADDEGGEAGEEE